MRCGANRSPREGAIFLRETGRRNVKYREDVHCDVETEDECSVLAAERFGLSTIGITQTAITRSGRVQFLPRKVATRPIVRLL